MSQQGLALKVFGFEDLGAVACCGPLYMTCEDVRRPFTASFDILGFVKWEQHGRVTKRMQLLVGLKHGNLNILNIKILTGCQTEGLHLGEV